MDYKDFTELAGAYNLKSGLLEANKRYYGQSGTGGGFPILHTSGQPFGHKLHNLSDHAPVSRQRLEPGTYIEYESAQGKELGLVVEAPPNSNPTALYVKKISPDEAKRMRDSYFAYPKVTLGESSLQKLSTTRSAVHGSEPSALLEVDNPIEKAEVWDFKQRFKDATSEVKAEKKRSVTVVKIYVAIAIFALVSMGLIILNAL